MTTLPPLSATAITSMMGLSFTMTIAVSKVNLGIRCLPVEHLASDEVDQYYLVTAADDYLIHIGVYLVHADQLLHGQFVLPSILRMIGHLIHRTAQHYNVRVQHQYLLYLVLLNLYYSHGRKCF